MCGNTHTHTPPSSSRSGFRVSQLCECRSTWNLGEETHEVYRARTILTRPRAGLPPPPPQMHKINLDKSKYCPCLQFTAFPWFQSHGECLDSHFSLWHKVKMEAPPRVWGWKMSCVLLSLASERGVKGDAGFPEQQVPDRVLGWGGDFSSARSRCDESLFFKSQLHDASYSQGVVFHSERPGQVKMEAGNLWRLLLCDHKQETFRARTRRATTAAPPHAVLRERESACSLDLAAEMGVCHDVNAIFSL